MGLASGSVRRALVRGRHEDVAGLAAMLARLFLLYSLTLAVLAVLGFSELAASLGTAVGFVGLGVAYAMKDVIGDVVSGVYLLRDPDFEVGGSVVTGEGDLLVASNSAVDKKWTKEV